MLPFLKNKNNRFAGVASPMVIERKPDEGKEEPSKDEGLEAIKACAKELIEAVHARDEAGVARAMKAAFDIMESMPHEEAEHEEQE